jgi:hypothetical protein
MLLCPEFIKWQKRPMQNKSENLEVAADRRADKSSLIIVWAFVCLSWIVLSSSEQMEASKSGLDVFWLEPWLTQLTSHIAIIGSILLIPFFLNRFPLSWTNWKKQLLIYVGLFFIFGALHIILMDVFRHLSFPIFLGRPYYEGLFDFNLWIYELRKDAYSFLLILSFFVTGRHIEQLRLEARSHLKDAKDTGRLTLKSGGRTILLNAQDILWVESASNYVEIHTEQGMHLARMTLSSLETLLSEAGDNHLRVHRSYLVKRNALREIIPSGEGGASITLTDGTKLPVGRKYRPNLELVS